MPLRSWILTLPYIANPNCEVMAHLNPYQWEGANGWNDTNAQTMVACSDSEAEARSLAAEMDCGIWNDSRYAACIPFGTCNPDWKPGVICVEWGEALNE
jgi:hypothetical protein